jgi:formylglycine-generating enzyme required for sulfatase activity
MVKTRLWFAIAVLLTCTSEYNAGATSQILTTASNSAFLTGSPPLDVQSSDLFLPLLLRPGLELPTPKSGSVSESINAFLSWELHDSQLLDPRYEVYLEAEDETPDERVAESLTHNSFDPITFEPNTLYYWRIVATGLDGKQIVGPIWQFHTEFLPSTPEVGQMVTVPAGEFNMGCDRNIEPCRSDETHEEEPLHVVYLDTYQIDKYEVTNSEYSNCVEVGVCNSPRRTNSATIEHYYGNPAYNYYPVLYTSWSDASTYCSWLHKRLPTEAEWEKAARGSIDTRRWPWGSEREDCSRVSVVRGQPCDALRKPDMDQVGAHPRNASPYGAMDMTGNAFEWVHDKYDVLYYQNSPYANPPGPDVSRPTRTPNSDETVYYTIRGGSNVDNWYYMRIVHRHFGHWGDEPMTDAPLFRSYRVGFRCARSVSN